MASYDNEIARIIGDYYRDLSANYLDYTEGKMPWPSHPYPQYISYATSGNF